MRGGRGIDPRTPKMTSLGTTVSITLIVSSSPEALFHPLGEGVRMKPNSSSIEQPSISSVLGWVCSYFLHCLAWDVLLCSQKVLKAQRRGTHYS